MAELETVDLVGVEIMSVGGPVHGHGSPPEGDFWTADDLRAMAAADADLHGELNPTVAVNPPKNTVGHVEQPAVGYLENLRLNEDETRLLADVRKVPKKLATLIEAGAYRSRSVTLAKMTSQATGKSYEWVVTGLAWLGAKLPAVRTLDDVVKLYGDGVEVLRVVQYAAGDVIWDPEAGCMDLMSDLCFALNGPAASMAMATRYSVDDVDTAGSRALVRDWGSDGDAWIVPYTLDADGDPVPAPPTGWTRAEQAWVEATKEYEARRAPGDSSTASDTPGEMDNLNLTDDQRRSFAEALGVTPESLTDEQVIAAVKAKPAPAADDAQGREFEQRLAAAEAKGTQVDELKRELHEERRTAFVTDQLAAGKAKPAQREQIEKMYDADPDTARRFFAEQAPDPDLVREYGSGDDNNDLTPEQQAENEDREYAATSANRFGFTTEELV